VSQQQVARKLHVVHPTSSYTDDVGSYVKADREANTRQRIFVHFCMQMKANGEFRTNGKPIEIVEEFVFIGDAAED
jgi:hypothetical protein